MTPCSPDIWEFHGQCIIYRIGSIGRGCITTFVLAWYPVLFVWHASPHAHEGLPYKMLTWDTDGVAKDILDISVTTAKGNRYVLVMVNCFSKWTEACPLPDKTALAVADAFFQHIVCRFGMPMVIHSDQGQEFENKVMQELCILCVLHIKPRRPHTIQKVMGWWNALIGRY